MSTSEGVRGVRRICFLSPHSDPLGRIGDPDTGGQCVYERELARALTQLAPDVAVDVYTRWYEPKSRHDWISERAQVIRIPCGGDAFIRKEDLSPIIPEFVAQTRAYAAQHQLTYDLVHGHYWDGGAASLLLLDDWRVPFIFTSHSLGKVKQRNLPDEAIYHYSVRIPKETEVMRQAQAIIALSRTELGYIDDLYGIDPAKVKLVPGGVDVEFFAPRGEPATLRRALGIPGDENYLVLALGRLDPRKGFPYLIEAAPEVVRRVRTAGKSVRVFISAGGHEPLSAEEQAEQRRIDEAIERAGIGEALTLVSKLDLQRVPEYYSAADVFVVPSPYEPFGLVIIEAMACGTPVIATDQGGPPEIISEGSDGYLVHPQDTALLAERISQMLLDDATRAHFREQARLKAVSTYSWEAIAHRILTLYEETKTQYDDAVHTHSVPATGYSLPG